MIILMEVWELATLRNFEFLIRDRLFLFARMEALMGPETTGYSAVNIESLYGGPDSDIDACFVRIQRKVCGLFDRLRAVEQ